jgi:hypothetical protein
MAEQDEDFTPPKRPDQSRLKVTKEELEASGLSLRDYMNKQLGLKRRDGSAPSAKAPAKAATSTSEAPKETPNFDPAGNSSDRLAESQWRSTEAQRRSDAYGETAKTNAKLEVENKAQQDSEKNKSWWTTPNANLKNGSLPSGKDIRAALGSKYAKGGKVSSASSRGDGIAQRGKTRGKIC